MNLEESHCQVTIRPNGGFVNARYRWFEGLMTIAKYLQSAKTPNIGSVSTTFLWAESLRPLEESFFSQRNYLRCFHKILVRLAMGFTKCNEYGF
jgi:hypothetical protein